jgi:hypothetical protein
VILKNVLIALLFPLRKIHGIFIETSSTRGGHRDSFTAHVRETRQFLQLDGNLPAFRSIDLDALQKMSPRPRRVALRKFTFALSFVPDDKITPRSLILPYCVSPT